MKEEFYNFYKTLDGIIDKKNDVLVVSLSGGVDSMVLTELLIKKNYNIICVHFNHKKRKESDVEEEYIKKYCKLNNILLEIYIVEITNPKNFQSDARSFRYEKLKEVCKKYNTKYILTAHHFDDLFETIIFKLLRGSSIKGYSGISIVNKSFDDFIFLRPLINYEKIELENYATKNKIKYFTDKSNFSLSYTRNKIRHLVIPDIKKIKNNLKEQVIGYSKKLNNAYNFINNVALSFISKYSDKFIISDFIKLDISIKEEVIAIILNKYNLKVKYNLINEIIKDIENNKPNIIKKIKNILFIKEYEDFYFKTISIENNIDSFIIKEYEKNNNEIISYSKNDLNFKMPMGVVKYNNEIKLPLTAFKNKEKNNIVLNYPFGRKKLSRLLIDRKVPKEKRNNIWIVKDKNNNILWIPKLYLNQTLKGDNKIYLKYEEENDK